MHQRFVGLAALFMTASCTGTVGGEAAESPPIGPRDPGLVDAPECNPDDDIVPTAPLRRLTRGELDRTYRALLGANFHRDLELEIGAIPEDAAWAAEGLDPQTFSHAEALVSVATRTGHLLHASPDRWSELGAACMVDGSDDCIDGWIEAFGLRTFRRPLSNDERTQARAFYDAAGDHAEGARRLVMWFLLSPSLLFHLELEGDEADGVIALDDYVVANRLSYRILGSMPDQRLLEAAENGGLSTRDAVDAEVRRLLTDPAGGAAVEGFFRDWLRLDGLEPAPAHLAMREGFDAVALQEAMVEEVEQFVAEKLWVDAASYRTLLQSTDTYASDPLLASIYGVEPWTPGSPAQVAGPERAGLLTRAALLAHKDTSVSPIERGVFLRRRILCDTMPSPDAQIVDSRLEEVDAFDPLTTSSRDQIATITAPDGCQTCHSLINGLAFPLEEFDAVGRFRTEEVRYDADGNVTARLPINASAVVVISDEEQIPVHSASELVDVLANNDKVAACLARTVYEYTRVRRARAEDSCGIAGLSEIASSDDPLSELFIQNGVEHALHRRLEEN
ncbi:MAG: DUF1592 domain-containing protein [Myxococcota bacterium]